jgi:imidazolonepropionase-like amidohydrolase
MTIRTSSQEYVMKLVKLGAAVAAVVAAVGSARDGSAQQQNPMRQFISVPEPVVALTNVKLIDGTGTAARTAMTVVIENGQIRTVGPTASTRPPANARVIDLNGHTVMPGIIGLHDHMYYSSVGGSMKPMLFSYPRLFLAAGVTTIRTTGSVDPYQELNLKAAIAAGQMIGPEIFVTGPYLQGKMQGFSAMHPLEGADDARRMVRYWAEEGVSWFKAYTTISRAELAAAIDEAHKHGVKVTAHLCSVGFREAVAAGIDNLEHGLLVNTEYQAGKQVDQCPMGSSRGENYANLDINSADVQHTIREMVQKNVSMTSTLAVMELSTPDRVPVDQRVLDAVFPDARNALVQWRSTERPVNRTEHAALKKAMEFERAFVAAGGTLAAGSDPCCLTAIAGYADQRNFELLAEAGFTPEQAAQIMSANGAKVLGIADRVGTIRPGMQADLIVLQGDLVGDPAAIRNVTHVFRKGVGYDPVKLTESIKGLIGIR